MVRASLVRASLAPALASLAFGLGACEISVTETVHGSGISGVESRAVSAFENVQVGGGLQVEIEVGAGPLCTLRGEANLLPYVTLTESAGTLSIDVREGFALDPPPTVALMAPYLARASVQGSSKLRASGVDSKELQLELIGSGQMRLLGRAQRVSANLTGSGGMRLAGLACETAVVTITGSGAIELSEPGHIEAVITGSGQLRHRGDAVVDSQVIGSGAVRQAAD